MTAMLGSFRALSVPARLLVINQFGINIGFYLVLPFLAVYLGGLGYAAATIGLVLALRNMSQQGLFLLVGTALFAVGMAVVDPFSMALLPVVGSEQVAGTYYGLYYLVSAAAVAGTNPASGALLEWAASADVRWIPFAALAAVGLAGAAVIAALQRRGALGERSSRTVAPHGNSSRTVEAGS